MFSSLSLYVWLVASMGVAYLVAMVTRHVTRVRRLKRTLSSLPSAPVHWFLGHLHEYPGMGPDEEEYIRKCVRERPRVDVFWLGNWFTATVRVWHPETVQTVLRTSEPKYIYYGEYRFGREWLGDGLVMSSGAKWARNRKLVNPAFHFEVLKRYIRVKNHCTQTLLDKFLQYADGESSVEMFEQFTKLTSDVALRCIFSRETDIQKEGHDQPYMKDVEALIELWTRRAVTPWMHPDWIYKLTRDGRRWKRAVNSVKRFSNEIIAEKKKTIGDSRKAMDFLDILLSARDEDGGGLSDDEILDEVNVMMFAGFETTSSALSWTAFSLAGHPQEQTRCQQEVDALMEGRDSEEITSEDLGKLPYLTLCIKEALRLHSIVPIIGREISKPLQIDGVEIPAYTMISVHIIGMNLSDHVWPEAMKYKPERFLQENIKGMHQYAFVPFSAGPRNCLGQQFAMNELKITLARLLRRLTFKVDAEKAPSHLLSVTMKSPNGVHLFLEKRT